MVGLIAMAACDKKLSGAGRKGSRDGGLERDGVRQNLKETFYYEAEELVHYTVSLSG